MARDERYDWFVSKHGSDASDGLSAASPMRSMEAARNRAQPGDTVHIGPGFHSLGNPDTGESAFDLRQLPEGVLMAEYDGKIAPPLLPLGTEAAKEQGSKGTRAENGAATEVAEGAEKKQKPGK